MIIHLNFLQSILDVLGQNSDGELFGTVLEQQVVAVAHLIVVGLVVESRDISRFYSATGKQRSFKNSPAYLYLINIFINVTPGRDLIPGNLLQHGVGQGVPQGDG